MNRSGNFGPARPCGHRKYEWDCKICLAAYNRKQAHRITEHELWVEVQKRLGLPTDMPLSKIVPRRMPLGHDWA